MSTKDLYRYFRIEARELLSGIAQSVLAMGQTAGDVDHVKQVLRLAHTLRSAMALMAATRTSAHKATFDTVSIVPSISTAWTTLPRMMTTARDE